MSWVVECRHSRILVQVGSRRGSLTSNVTTARNQKSACTAMCPLTGTIPDNFERLEARFIAEFRPPLRPEQVQHCVGACRTTYRSATVRNYLSLLVERDARDRLRVLASSRTA